MPYTPIPNVGNQDLRPNAYSAVGGKAMSQTVISDYDLYKPNELVQVFERHLGYVPFRLMIRAMGFSGGTYKPTVGHYEYPWKENLITIGAIGAGGGPGQPLTITLDAADMYNTNVTAGGAARQGSFPVKNELIQLPDGNVAVIQNKNTAVTPHQLTLAPLDPAVDLTASVNVGEQYFIASNNHGEGSGLPDGRVPRVITYSNTFQIVKEASYATGSSLTNAMYFEPVPGKPGTFYHKVKADMMERFEKRCDGALIWGQPNNNPTVVNEFNQELGFDVALSGTEGLIPYAVTNGNIDAYTVGSYSINDLDDLSRYYESERIGTRDMMALQGVDINIELENTITSLLNADLTALLSKRWMRGDSVFNDQQQPMDPSDLALMIGFRAIKKSNYNYVFKMMHTFNEAIGAGASAYNYRNWQLIVPVGYAAQKDRNATLMPTMGYEHKELDGYSRETVVGDFSGAGVGGSGYRVAVNPIDIHTCFMVSEIAGHFTCANHITIQRPV